jgi:hypothetical protein
MEYELYFYCTGMGTFIIFLILLYHCLGQDEKQRVEIAESSEPKNV